MSESVARGEWTITNLEAEVEREGLDEQEARTLVQLAKETNTRCERIDPQDRVRVIE